MSKNAKGIVPYTKGVSKNKPKKSKKNVTFTCNLTGFIEKLYSDNLRLTDENAALRGQIVTAQIVDGEFIVLEPVTQEDKTDD